MRKTWPVVLIMVLALLPWGVNAAKFYYNLDAQYSDLTISHLPNAMFLKNSIQSDGEIPLWSDAILSGSPFAADPLSGIWYPPGWIAFILPSPMGFNLAALLHILWGGLGMFFLLLSLNLRREAALTGSLAFILMPKLFSHLSAGHVTLVYAVSWTPWLFLAEVRRQDQPTAKRLKRILPGMVLGVIFLADPRWSLYAAAAWLGYSLWQYFGRRRNRSFREMIRSWLPGTGIQAVLAWCIAAVLLLPLLEYTLLSTRSSMTTADVLAFSLPPTQLAGLLLPNIGGYAEWQVYPGALILVLVIYAAFLPRVRKKAVFWLILAGAALALSLGSFWPFAESFAALPGFDLIRVPSRAWFLTGMGLIITAGYALDDVLTNPVGRPKPDPMIVLLPITSLVVFLTFGLAFLGETPSTGFIWGAVALTLSLLFLFLLRKQSQGKAITATVMLFVIVDLAGVNWLGTTFRTNCEVMAEGFEAANFIARQPGTFRVYSPSYSLPQHTAAAEGLELIDGINPLQLASYNQFMIVASGVEPGGYSVTVPGFATGDPEVDNREPKPDTELLGLLNGKYIVSAFELSDPRLEEVWRSSETRVYENLDSLPRAWVQPTDGAPGKEVLSEVRLEVEQANLLVARAEGPGIAVFSIPDYPGWQVFVNDKSTDKVRIANLLIGVPLESGTHQITLKFSSMTLNWGLAISLASWILVLITGLAPRRKKKEGESEEN